MNSRKIRYLASLFVLFFWQPAYAELNISDKHFEEYAKLFVKAVKTNDTDLYRTLSTGEDINGHFGLKRILDEAGDRQYDVEVKPFNKDDPFFNLLRNTKTGKCDHLVNLITHTIKMNWDYVIEKYPDDKDRHVIESKGGTVFVYVNYDNGRIMEQVCEH